MNSLSIDTTIESKYLEMVKSKYSSTPSMSPRKPKYS